VAKISEKLKPYAIPPFRGNLGAPKEMIPMRTMRTTGVMIRTSIVVGAKRLSGWNKKF
jgi:hypothetical protein